MWVARDLWAQPPGVAEPVVRGVSFAIGRGEWLAVTGANGCGKSTLALAAAGLLPVSRGCVEVDGVPLEPNASSRATLRIAVVLQEPASQLFERRVDEEIAFTSRNLGTDPDCTAASVSEWSVRLGLVALLNRDPHTLSAGWQQRVLIAGAMASDPRLLVVDEGAAHMDAGARARVLGEIRAATRGGLSVLWVTQDEGEAAAADRILRLVPGGRMEDCVRSIPVVRSIHGEPGASLAAADESGWAAAPQAASACVRIEPPQGAEGRRISVREPLEFTLAAGAPVALVGPNGSGKTVALEAIAGFSASSQVRVREASTPTQGPVLAVQYPELQVFGDTVSEELCYGPIARGSDPGSSHELATQLIVELGFDPKFMSRSTWAISVGERRLVQIAATLLTPASRVAIDEPTCGLDPERGERLARILARFGERVPLLVATQDPLLPRRIGASEQRLGEISLPPPSLSRKTD